MAVDLVGRTRMLFDAIADADKGGDIDAFLAAGIRYRDGGLALDRAASATHLRERAAAARAAGHRLVLLDIVPRRNLVFASYAWQDETGSTKRSGTAVLSFDRDGRVFEWMEM